MPPSSYLPYQDEGLGHHVIVKSNPDLSRTCNEPMGSTIESEPFYQLLSLTGQCGVMVAECEIDVQIGLSLDAAFRTLSELG
jgi:hypothetical protein